MIEYTKLKKGFRRFDLLKSAILKPSLPNVVILIFINEHFRINLNLFECYECFLLFNFTKMAFKF